MKKFVIIRIEDNNEGPDGHIIIVKANPVSKTNELEKFNNSSEVVKYNYCVHECKETEIFIVPFSESMINYLIMRAMAAELERTFWEPIDDDFFDLKIMTEDGKII